MIEVLCLGAWQGHYERQVAVWHDADEHNNLDLRLGQTISNIQRIAGEVNLPLVSRLVGVVIGYVMVLAVLCDMLLELCVAVSVRTLLSVVVLKDVLHVGVAAREAPHDLRHHRCKFLLACILRNGAFAILGEQPVQLGIRKEQQLSDTPAVNIDETTCRRYFALAAMDLAADPVLRHPIAKQLKNLPQFRCRHSSLILMVNDVNTNRPYGHVANLTIKIQNLSIDGNRYQNSATECFEVVLHAVKEHGLDNKI